MNPVHHSHILSPRQPGRAVMPADEGLNIPLDIKKRKPQEILVYHDKLLSMLAWAENKESRDRAKKAMDSLAAALKKILPGNKRMGLKLSGTGIPGTEITGRFSYAVTKWLVDKFPADVALHSSEASPETIRLFFRQLLPPSEYEAISSGELNLLQRIKKLKGKSRLPGTVWLLNHFETAGLPEAGKEIMFHQLELFVTWKLNHPVFNRSYISIPQKIIAYHPLLNKTPDLQKIVNRRLPAPVALSVGQKNHLLDVAKASLVFLFRETDPFSFASAEGVKLFELENGFSISLYSMKKSHRLSIEAYNGYLVFKNGIPVAYGGGWIFGGRCQFGINVLPPFRGSESARIFSELIRVYHQYFGAKRFVIKPYQFGKNNPEALLSGAFWFYYKLGFKPEEPLLQQLAEKEVKKKKANPGYRSSTELLKKFTGSLLVLEIAEKAVPDFDAALVSRSITDYINKKFNGNRQQALAESVRKTRKELNIQTWLGWNSYQKIALQQWSLLVQATLRLDDWKAREKKQLLRLIRSKADDNELNFISCLQGHRRFWKDLMAHFSLSPSDTH